MKSLQNPIRSKGVSLNINKLPLLKLPCGGVLQRPRNIKSQDGFNIYMMCTFFIVILRPTKSKRRANANWQLAPRYRDADLRSGYDCLLMMWLISPPISYGQCCAC